MSFKEHCELFFLFLKLTFSTVIVFNAGGISKYMIHFHFFPLFGNQKVRKLGNGNTSGVDKKKALIIFDDVEGLKKSLTYQHSINGRKLNIHLGEKKGMKGKRKQMSNQLQNGMMNEHIETLNKENKMRKVIILRQRQAGAIEKRMKRKGGFHFPNLDNIRGMSIQRIVCYPINRHLKKLCLFLDVKEDCLKKTKSSKSSFSYFEVQNKEVFEKIPLCYLRYFLLELRLKKEISGDKEFIANVRRQISQL